MNSNRNYTSTDIDNFNSYVQELITVYENSIKDLISGYDLNNMINETNALELDLDNVFEVNKYINTQYKLIIFNLYSRQYSTLLGLYFLMQKFHSNDYLSLPISATIRPILEDFPYISYACSKFDLSNNIEHKRALCRLYFNQYENILPDVKKFTTILDIKLNKILEGKESKIYTNVEIAEQLIDNSHKEKHIQDVIKTLDKIFGDKKVKDIYNELLENQLYSDNYIINQLNYQKISKVIHFGAVGDEMFPEHNDHLLSTIFYTTTNSIKTLETLGILSEIELNKKYYDEYIIILAKIHNLGVKIGIIK